MLETIETFPSGSTLLDCVLGGGFPVGSLIHIEGDTASGKTLLLLEAAANHLLKWPDSKIWLCENEPSFDKSHAHKMGIPVDKIEWWEDIHTLEEWYRRIQQAVDAANYDPNCHALIALDSLDALSDEEELERDIGKGTYGAAKAKKASEAFRRISNELEKINVTTIIISQLRDVLNSPFPMKISSGGNAIRFYRGIGIRLTEKKPGGKITRTSKGIERVVGLKVVVKCIKNKVALPFRECDLTILFNHGIDDFTSNLEFLKSVTGGLDQVSPIGEKKVTKENITDFVKKFTGLSSEERSLKRTEVSTITRKVWDEIESNFTVEPKY